MKGTERRRKLGNYYKKYMTCLCCGGRLPKKGSVMWNAKRSEECPGYITIDGWCGRWEGCTPASRSKSGFYGGEK